MENKPETEIHHYRDRQVVLYRRERSARWQARFRLEKGGWHRFSTLQYELKKAEKYACEQFDEARFRTKYDKPEVSRRFSSIAKLAIAEMQAELDAEMGKIVYRTYISVIKLYLVPYFGHKHIDNIKPQEYKTFLEDQETKLGKQLTRSTINNYNSALNRIFDIAVTNGWMGKSQVPTLKNKGAAGKRRPDFSLDEYRLMTRRLREWAKPTEPKESTRMVRELLQDYVLFLANTGMRPGKEIDNLKWKHISWFTAKDGIRYIRIEMNSTKTGKRDIIGRHNIVHFLTRIKNRFADLSKMSIDQLLKAKVDEYVFRLRNGKRCFSLNQNFERFLEENNLLQDSHGQNRVLYSLRHTYATFALLRGNNISMHDLAKNMGTSIGMIEKHYSHLSTLLRAKDLAGPIFSKKAKNFDISKTD